MKPRQWLLLIGVLLAAGLLAFGEREGGEELAQPVARRADRPAAPSAAQPTAAKAPVPAPAQGEPALRVLQDRARQIADARANQRATPFFAEQSWAPPPAPPPKPEASAPPVPVAPPLPFSYVGRQSRGGPVEVFLAQGDKIHVVHEGSVIDGRYRLDAITPGAVAFTFLPLNQAQQLTIRVTD